MLTFLEYLDEQLQYFAEAKIPGVQLFNIATGIPKELLPGPPPGMRLTYGAGHARPAIVYDEKLTQPPLVVPGNYTLVEVEATNGRASKWLIRTPIHETPRTAKLAAGVLRDLALVILPNGIVKTGWTNARNDTHFTLDRSKYDNPRDFRPAR